MELEESLLREEPEGDDVHDDGGDGVRLLRRP